MADTEKKIIEYRGCRGVVAAVLITDNSTGLTYGEVFPLAGAAEITKSVDSSNESHFYDNEAQTNVSSVGDDSIKFSMSAIPFPVLSKILGEDYDEKTGIYTEGNADPPYCAVGYVTTDTDGTDYYVWRYKGKFSIPEESHKTKDKGTDASGQELTYTGINTRHKFENRKTAKGFVYNSSKGLITETEFFSKVTLKDEIQASS